MLSRNMSQNLPTGPMVMSSQGLMTKHKPTKTNLPQPKKQLAKTQGASSGFYSIPHAATKNSDTNTLMPLQNEVVNEASETNEDGQDTFSFNQSNTSVAKYHTSGNNFDSNLSNNNQLIIPSLPSLKME